MAKSAVKTRMGKANFTPREALRRFVDSFDNLLESVEYASPGFWKEIEASRKSGVVSAKEIEKRLGIK